MIHQLTIPQLEEDILASSLRQQQTLFDALIQDLQSCRLSHQDATERLRLLERGLKRLSLAN